MASHLRNSAAMAKIGAATVFASGATVFRNGILGTNESTGAHRDNQKVDHIGKVHGFLNSIDNPVGYRIWFHGHSAVACTGDFWGVGLRLKESAQQLIGNEDDEDVLESQRRGVWTFLYSAPVQLHSGHNLCEGD